MATPSSSSSPATQIMLAIYEKKTTAVDLYRPLRNYIVYNYSEREAQNLEDDLQTLKQYRTDIERSSPSDSLSSRRDLLINYFRALTAIESRFPISPETDHINTLTFVWHDAFKNKLKASQQNIHLEKAAVLFNLGAVHSQLGLGFDRGEVEGRKNASHSFMKAAGVFAFLRDNVAMKACMGNSTTLDVSVECVGMLERLMLAQAQECVFENTIAKGSSASVCSKISRQVGIFYEEALAALKVAPLSQHFEKAWHSHVQLKAALFYAEACYRYGLELHEKEEIGEEIARLKSGLNALSEARKSSPKGAAQQLIDAYTILEGNLNRNLERAVKENDRVYLMRVPPASSLQPLPAFQMVKTMPMTEVFDASKEKMFASLVPDSSAKALSRYTEMVDDVIRTQAEILQQGSELTRVRLKEMDLPESILALEGHSALPTALKEDDRLNRFAANLKQAAESDTRIERSVREHSSLMSILDRHPIESVLPTLGRPIMSLDANEDAILGALKQSLRQLETLGAQRAGLEDMLKEMKRKDDILPKLMTSTGSYDDLFRKEISKYDQICQEIGKNVEAQEHLLLQIQAQSNEFAAVFNIEDYKASREKCFKQIEAAIAKYQEIKENINEGLKFYVTLQDAITNMKQQCSDFVMTRSIQCREMIEEVQRQMAGLSFQDSKNTGNYNYPAVGQANQPQRTSSQQTKAGNIPQQSHPQSQPYYSAPQQPNTSNIPQQSHPQSQPYYSPPQQQPPQQPNAPGYGQPPPPYGSQQQQPPYHLPAARPPYTSPQNQQQPGVPHEYGQPAYPGWQGPYYNAPGQQPGSMPRPPYTVPAPYPPPNQGGYYRQ
uniref:BRO1 domain-containing protein n=1 Tax=Daucus carota subsp. sativus TaxID=79200 RepID=A0A164SQJ6_DAUCS